MDAITPPDMLKAESQGASPAAMLAAIPKDPPKPVTHDVTIVSTKKLAAAKVLGVPPEEFGIERGARDIKTSNYCFHEIVTKTEGQLIAEGFDEEQIKALSDYRPNSDPETTARDTVTENTGNSSTNTSARLVRITEHYVRMDYQGNGKPCLYLVVTGGEGGDILKRDGKEVIQPIDVIPFAATTPVPITHRFFGRSIADLVMPLQREKTALKRGALDNLYLHNNPRVDVAESHAGPNTLDDLLVARPGGVVRTKQPGGLEWQVVPDITGSIYPMMQYIDAELEARTGLSKQTQGVDANALQNQSATAVAQVFSASQMRMKLIARIMAEGVRDIFSLLHHTIRSHGQEKQTVRLRNQWVPVDPRDWKTRNDTTINVGLGTGGKAQQFAQMMALANFQKEVIAGGLTQLVGPKEVYNTGAELTKILGHKNPDKFLNDPDAKDPKTGQPLHPPPPPQPSPEEVKGKVQMAIADKQAANDAQADQRKAEIEAVQARADIETNNKKVEADIILNREKAASEERLAVLQFNMDNERNQREHEYRMAQLHAKTASDREKHEQNMEAGALKAVQGQESHEQKMEAVAAKPEAGK